MVVCGSGKMGCLDIRSGSGCHMDGFCFGGFCSLGGVDGLWCLGGGKVSSVGGG